MADEELTGGIRAEAVDQVEDTGWNTYFVHHFGEQGGGRGSFFRRFHYNRVAAGERRCDFPAEQQQRKIPWRDDADDADWFADGVVQGFAAIDGFSLKGFEAGCFNDVSEGAEIGGGARDVESRGKCDGLAGVGDFSLHEAVEAGLDGVGDLVEHGGTIANTASSPFALYRTASGMDGGVDHGLISFGHRRDGLAVSRIDVGELALTGDEVAVDVVVKRLQRTPTSMTSLMHGLSRTSRPPQHGFLHAAIDQQRHVLSNGVLQQLSLGFGSSPIALFYGFGKTW